MKLSEVRRLGLDLLALAWPTACVHCGVADRDCCDACAAEARSEGGCGADVVEVVGAGAGSGADAGLGLGAGSGGSAGGGGAALSAASPVPVLAAGDYEGPVRSMLIACKHEGRTGFARLLGERLAAPLAVALHHAEGILPPIIVCAPSRASRRRERGYDHVELIVGRALRVIERRGSERSSIRHRIGDRRAADRRAADRRASGPRGSHGRNPVPSAAPFPARPRVVSALRAARGRVGQVGLRAAEREENARRVVVKRRCRELLRGREVILVDDISTTGATLRGCCERLQREGARVVAAVVLCRVPRNDTRE